MASTTTPKHAKEKAPASHTKEPRTPKPSQSVPVALPESPQRLPSLSPAPTPKKRGQYKKREFDPNWTAEDDALLAEAFATHRDDWINIKRALDHRKKVPEIRKRAKELNLVTTLITGESSPLIIHRPVTSKRASADVAAKPASKRSRTASDTATVAATATTAATASTTVTAAATAAAAKSASPTLQATVVKTPALLSKAQQLALGLPLIVPRGPLRPIVPASLRPGQRTKHLSVKAKYDGHRSSTYRRRELSASDTLEVEKLANATYIMERAPCEDDGILLHEMFGTIFQTAANDVQDTTDDAPAYREVYRALASVFNDETTTEIIDGILSDKACIILNTLVKNLYTRLKMVGCLEHRRHAIRKLELLRDKILGKAPSKRRQQSVGDVSAEREGTGDSVSGEVEASSGAAGATLAATALPNTANPLNVPHNLIDPFKGVRGMEVGLIVLEEEEEDYRIEGDEAERETEEVEVH